jgi:hemolysin D
MEMAMHNDFVLDLADCTEFRQALLARPPRIVHGTAGLLVVLFGMALAWAAATHANLVVRSTGRVRPVATPVKVFSGARGEVLSASIGGRVAEVNARIGDVVRQGDVLVRLETARLDNEIAKQDRTIRAGEEELVKLAQLGGLLIQQYVATQAKAEAELGRAREEARRAREQRDSEIRLARLGLSTAEVEEISLQRLAKLRAVAPMELQSAAAKTREAKEKLVKALIQSDESGVQVAQRALELAHRDYDVRQQELDLKRTTKRGEIASARLELANLDLERRQAAIRAPIDGVVIKGDVKLGDILEPAKPVLELARQEGFLFEGSIPSEEVGHLKVGMAARIKLDAYNYQQYGTVGGTIRFLSPDSEAGGGAERTVTYTVKIALASDELGRGEYRGRVKLGMTGQADIVTGHRSLLALLVKRIRQTICLD